MSTRVAVVTGSNKGIGLSIVKLLAPIFEGDVILTSRDVGRGEAAVKQLEDDFGVKVKFHQLDIEDHDSIVALKDFLVATYGGLDVLVNNAAIAYKQAATEPFLEQATNTIKTNYTATLNVCDVLFPILKAHARVVNLSSSAGMLQRIPSEELREQLSNEHLTVGNLNDLVSDYLRDVQEGVHEKNWGGSAYVVSKVIARAPLETMYKV